MWIATGEGSANSIAYSTDGITWTGLGLPLQFSGPGRNIDYNANVTVAVGLYGGAGNTINYTSNGITWTGAVNSGTIFNGQANGIKYSATQDLWIATGGATNNMAYSKNGSTWTGMGVISTIATSTTCVGYSDKQGIWIAGAAGGNSIAYSTNGTTWTGIPSSSTVVGAPNFVSYSTYQDLWVIAGSGGNTAAYSKNGYNWTGSSTTTNGYCITYSPNKDLWMTANEYSKNGINWTTITQSGNKRYIACNDLIVVLKTSAMNIQNWYNPDNATVTSGYVTSWNDSLGVYNLTNVKMFDTVNTMTKVIASGTTSNVIYQTATFSNNTSAYLYGNTFSETVYAVMFCCNTTAYTTVGGSYYMDPIFCNYGNSFGIRYTVSSPPTMDGNDLNSSAICYMNGTIVQNGGLITLKSKDSLPTGFTIYCYYIVGSQRTRITQLTLLGESNSCVFTGYAGDFFIGNANFTTTHQRQLEGYLGYKYKCQSSLPTTHPYYSATNSIVVTLSVG